MTKGGNMQSDEQLALWVEGKSVHNNDERDECCPDFSCCRPGLQAPKAVREAFRDANAEDRQGFLMLFLGALLDSTDVKGYVAGGKPAID